MEPASTFVGVIVTQAHRHVSQRPSEPERVVTNMKEEMTLTPFNGTSSTVDHSRLFPRMDTRAFTGKTIVIKYGGKAMTEDALKDGFARDVVLTKDLGLNPVIVHGGGPEIDRMLKQLGIEAKFRQGVRVTDQATMDVVEMVLGGKINQEIVALLNRHGARAVGLTGKDSQLILSKPFSMKSLSETLDVESDESLDEGFGLVGEVESVDAHLLQKLVQDGCIPVIAPIGVDHRGRTYNINADLVAGAVAAAIKADRLLMLSDTKGVLDAKRQPVPRLTRKDLQRMVKAGTISDGMLPKIHACLTALERGVKKAHIIDGRMSHSLLLDLFADKGIGTEILSSVQVRAENQSIQSLTSA